MEKARLNKQLENSTEDKENVNTAYRDDGTPPTKVGKTDSTQPMEGQKPNEFVAKKFSEPGTVVGKTEIEKKLDDLEARGIIPSENEAKKQVEEAKDSDVKPVEKPLNPEQEEALVKHKAKEAEKQKIQLEKKKKAYQMLQTGAYFMKFIFDDIERQKKDHMNRPQRRRFTKELRKGIFSKELVDVYASKIDQAMEWIDSNLNNPTQTKNKIATHYHTQGYKNGEFLKSILQNFFKGKFLLPGEEVKEVDGADYYKDLKEKEAKGKLSEN